MARPDDEEFQQGQPARRRPGDEDEGEYAEGPPRRRRPDDADELDRPRRQAEEGWLDKQFAGTSVVVIVLASLCCGVFALVFGIVGLASCQNPKARDNAKLMVIISGIMVGLGIVLQVLQLAVLNR
jgi:hypothetical protein